MSAVPQMASNEIQKDVFYAFESIRTYCDLESINGIKFTPREIDVMACILGGRGRKTAGSLLSIAEKTVETHIRNILSKLGCNSQEGIRERLEKSDKFLMIKRHYQNLLTESAFEQTLIKASVSIKEENPVCLFITWQDHTQNSFVNFKKHFQHLNIKLVMSSRGQYKSVESLIQFIEGQGASFVIYAIPQTSLISSSAGTSTITEEILEISKKTSAQFLFLFESKEETLDINQTFNDLNPIFINEEENYYFMFFNILARVMPNAERENVVSAFKTQHETINGALIRSFPGELEANLNHPSQNKSTVESLNSGFLRSKKNRLIGGSVLSFIFISIIIFLYIFGNKLNLNIGNHIYKPHSSIRSDFIIPPESVFLHRSEFISQITNKFNGQAGIHTVALIGAGGSGKTTLAREFARQETASIVWELNAATDESLKRSFESLALALSKTEEDKTALRRIHEIKNTVEKENHIIQFVKEHMKLQPEWFLIYDNVENISDLQKYFPQDLGTWGNGKVIITTCDSTIQNSNLVNAFVPIGELNADQKLSLFTKIMTQGNQEKFTQEKLIEAKAFLEKIPSFPLDVSIAAYYLKVTNTPYSIYLENINRYDQDFINVQESLLKGAGEYAKSRYGILALSLQRLIETHKEFKDLLLFIFLLGPQNIPTDLLKGYKGNTLIDNFIYNLKKYSLVTNDQSLPSIGTVFSVHNSTQVIGLAYLTKVLNLKKDNQSLKLIAVSLEKYVDDTIGQENLLKLKLLASHCEAFLSHDNFLNDDIRASLESVLGCVYFDLCDYVGAKQLLEKSLIHLNHHPNENQIKIVRTLTYLGNAYRELGYYDKAKNFLEQAVRIYQSSSSENDLQMAQALTYLGNVYRNLGDYKKAQNLLEQSLRIYKEHFSENHVGIARLLSYLGHVYKEQGKYDKARDFLEKSLVIYKENFPDDHLGIVRSLIYLANLHKSLGNYEKAKNLLEQSLILYKKYFPEDHRDFAWVYIYLGNVSMDLGNYEKAKNQLEEGFSIHKKYFPHDHMDTAWIFTYLGNAYKKTGNYKKARILLEQSLAIYKKYLSEDHIDIAWASVHLASVFMSLGNYEEARNLLEKSLTIYQMNFSETHTDVAWIKSYLGEVYFNLKNYDKAQKLLEESLTTYKSIFKEENAKISSVYIHLGNIYKELKDLKNAKSLFEKSLTYYENHYGKDHIKVAQVLRNLGQIYLSEGNIEGAETLLNRALSIFQQNKHPEVYTLLECLAELRLKQSTQAINKNIIQSQAFKKQAIDYLRRAKQIIIAHFSENSPHIIRIQSKLGNIEK